MIAVAEVVLACETDAEVVVAGAAADVVAVVVDNL
jgi:hypothetical protein